MKNHYTLMNGILKIFSLLAFEKLADFINIPFSLFKKKIHRFAIVRNNLYLCGIIS